MNRTSQKPGDVRQPRETGTGDVAVLAKVVDDLQRNLEILEAFDLTMAIALLDNAIAEVRKHVSA